MVARIWAAFWMCFWIGLMLWGVLWLEGEGRWLMGHNWPFTGLAIALAGLVITVVCGRGLWLVLMLLSGRTSVRLARRDFRNSLANLVMFAKTGLWKV